MNSYTLDQIADACVYAGMPDSTFETLCINLEQLAVTSSAEEPQESVKVIRGIMEFIRLHAKPGGFDPALAERRVNARLDKIEAAFDAQRLGRGSAEPVYQVYEDNAWRDTGWDDYSQSADDERRIVYTHPDSSISAKSAQPTTGRKYLQLRTFLVQADPKALERFDELCKQVAAVSADHCKHCGAHESGPHYAHCRDYKSPDFWRGSAEQACCHKTVLKRCEGCPYT